MPRKIVTDIARAKELPLVSSVELGDDDTVTLGLSSLSLSFLITITEDYPHGSTFYFNQATNESGALDGDLIKICEVLCKKFGGGAPPKTSASASASCPPVQPTKDGDNNAQLLSSSPGMGTQQATTSTTSGGDGGGFPSSLSSQGPDDFELEEQGPTSSDILRDVELARNAGIHVEMENVALGIRFGVFFRVDDLINDSTAMAWGFNRSAPFRLELRFERAADYLKCQRTPDVFVTQDKKPVRYGQQIKSFLENYLHEHWDRWNGWTTPRHPLEEKDEEGVGAGPSAKPPSRQPRREGADDDDDEFVSQHLEQAVHALSPEQKGIFQQLREMLGFGDEMSVAAAQQAPTLQKAVDMCLGENPPTLAAPSSASSAAAPAPAPPPTAVAVTHSRNNGDSSAGGRGGGVVGSATEWLKRKDSPFDERIFYRYDAEHDGFLLHLVKYIRHRTKTAHLFCVICDKPHVMEAGMLRPSCCQRDICVFRFQQLSIGKDATDSVATGGGVIDLLVTMFKAAALSSRANVICEPFPTIADASSGKLILDPKAKDFSLLNKIVKDLPDTKEFIGVESRDHLHAKLTKCNPLCFPLLEWIISSNRSLIVKLRPEHRLKEAGTPHQFLFLSASPEKQAIFDEKKKKYGSVFAFHGSPPSNWHSIIRRGLQVGSGNELQVTDYGYYGKAVYTAPASATSLGYANRDTFLQTAAYNHNHRAGGGGKTTHDLLTENEGYIHRTDFLGMAIVEIVKNAYKSCAGDTEWTVTDSDSIQTRFLLIFTNQAQYNSATHMDTRQSAFDHRIREVMESLKTSGI